MQADINISETKGFYDALTDMLLTNEDDLKVSIRTSLPDVRFVEAVLCDVLPDGLSVMDDGELSTFVSRDHIVIIQVHEITKKVKIRGDIDDS